MTGIRQQYTVKDLGIDLLCDIAGAFLFNIGIYNFAVNAEFAPVASPVSPLFCATYSDFPWVS